MTVRIHACNALASCAVLIRANVLLVVTVGWQAVEYNVSENCGSVSIAIMKQGSNAIPVTVLFSTSDMEASGKIIDLSTYCYWITVVMVI